jgi:hypothetical protein
MSSSWLVSSRDAKVDSTARLDRTQRAAPRGARGRRRDAYARDTLRRGPRGEWRPERRDTRLSCLESILERGRAGLTAPHSIGIYFYEPESLGNGKGVYKNRSGPRPRVAARRSRAAPSRAPRPSRSQPQRTRIVAPWHTVGPARRASIAHERPHGSRRPGTIRMPRSARLSENEGHDGSTACCQERPPLRL